MPISSSSSSEKQPLVSNHQFAVPQQGGAPQYYPAAGDAQEYQNYQEAPPQFAPYQPNGGPPPPPAFNAPPPLPPQLYANPEVITADPENALADPLVGALISFLLPGITHIVLKQKEKGIFFLIVHFTCIIIACVAAAFFGPLPYLLVLVDKAIVMYDGYAIAAQLRDEGYVFKGECPHWITSLGAKMFVKSVNVFVTGSDQDPRRMMMGAETSQEVETAV
eukprot:CAMPEP_0117451868 /NCGR_PEP_ID=MMETSP0759-20121206/9255_1 /TAXON_ID=63605 /ORGANISM="Percolomonas cosmopolitus, Strain WS" /LENGTH=220 /DNA_ID=CAMNT_0005244533 /DNA_START=42 /DNA_END=704 /DNA_ORIENTATION=-